MMKKNCLLIGFILYSITVLGQPKGNFSFDIEDFNKKAEVAAWLYEYDAVAWWTSDSVMTEDTLEIKRLGNEWFCFQTEDRNWHAVYGKYASGVFDGGR